MSIEEGMVAALEGDSGVSALVGARIYHMQMPQNPTFPCLTYQRAGTAQSGTLDGVNTLTEVRIQVDCWGSTVASVKSVAAAVKALLHGHKGALGGTACQYVRRESEFDLGDFDGDDQTRRVSTDYIFTLHE